MIRLRKKNLFENEKQIVSLNPKSLMSHFYNKVDLTTASIVIFISIFLETLFLFFLKVPNIISFFTIRILVSFVFSWIILGGIYYVLLYFIKGKDNLSGGEYKKILSGLSSFRVISILSLLFVLGIVLIFMPNLLSFIANTFQNPSLFINSGMLPSLGVGGIIGVIILILFSIFLVIYYLLMVYQFVKEMYNMSNLGNILMTIVIIVIMYFFAIII